MIRPSPNEFERLKNEEFIKRRLLRLKEVREHSKNNASKLRNLYKAQKSKVLTKLAENIQLQMNAEDEKKLEDLKSKYEKQYNALGSAHSNAADWIDPVILMQEKAENCAYVAQGRHLTALNQVKVDKEEKDALRNNRLNSLNLAMLIEKERAAAIASLPTPTPFNAQEYLKDMEDMTPRVKVCDRNKFSVIESYEVGSYNVERGTEDSQTFQYNVNNAMDAGEIRHQQLLKMNTDILIEGEEKSIIAQLRGHQAFKKQIVKKDYGELLTNLEQISKCEMAKRQREYHKNEFVGPNSPGHVGMGHMAAMLGYKERCRERAVESAVMESLKDITNKSFSDQSNVIVESSTKENKLSKLYDIIKKQKENVTFENVDPNENLTTSSVEINQDHPKLFLENDEESINLEQVGEVDSTRITLKEAMTATLKSSLVLDKSKNEREIFNIEKTIENIDKRLDQIKERDECRESISSNVSSSRLTQGMGYIHEQSEECSDILSSASVCSDSLKIIREFQRNALMKLSGYPSTEHSKHHLCTSNGDLLQTSLDSSCISERSVSRLTQVRDMYHHDDISLSSETTSSVSEWVKSQLTQTITKLPDWVTKGDPHHNFLPDVNMSFMSSILNIRSESGSLKDDTNSSCSTLLTRSSIVRRTEQSSITEISKIGSDGRHTPSLDHQSDNSKRFVEPCSSGSTGLKDYTEENNKSNIVEDPHFLKKYAIDSNFCEDLINFESVEDLSKSRSVHNEEDISYLSALKDLVNIAEKSFCKELVESDDLVNFPVSLSYDDEDSTLITLLSNPDSKRSTQFIDTSHDIYYPNFDAGNEEKDVSYQAEDICGDNASISVHGSDALTALECVSFSSKYPCFSKDKALHSSTSLNVDLPLTNEDSSLINDYENFLSGLVRAPLLTSCLPLNDENDLKVLQSVDVSRCTSKDIINSEGSNEKDGQDNTGLINITAFQKDLTIDEKDMSRFTGENKDISYVTSTTKEGHIDLITLSLSSVQTSNIIQQSSQHNSQSLFNDLDFHADEISSKDGLEPLSSYVSETSESILSKRVLKLSPSTTLEESITTNQEVGQVNKKRVKNLLSSTMMPNRQNARMISPEVSSISNISVEACNQLKQKIMQEYFQKNRNTILAGLTNTESTGLSLKPLESYDENSPRNLDSGKPSSRLTMEFSELNTARLTSEDIFMTPRTDTNWTDYTPRDEWSTSHTNYQALSDYVSTLDNDNLNTKEYNFQTFSEPVDLDETLKYFEDASPNVEHHGSIDLIKFDSNDEINEGIFLPSQNIQNNVPSERPSLSDESALYSPDLSLKEDSITSKESSDQTVSSFHILTSYHSSTSEIPSRQLNTKDILEFESHNDSSVDSKSEADISSVSLASFLRNESLCQESEFNTPCESTPKHKVIPNKLIDNTEEMKTNLALWKKERLTRINQVIPDFEKERELRPSKTSVNRRQDEVVNKSRTLRLYNNLEEVQKMNQKKEAEQKKIDNQLKKKEYAEKLRKIRREKTQSKV